MSKPIYFIFHCLILSFALSTPFSGAFAQLNFYENLPLGEYGVGFKQVQIDEGAKAESGRIKISIWYPAQESNAQSTAFADYLDLDKTLTNPELVQKLSEKIGGEFPVDSMNLILQSSAIAIPDAPERDGKFPLVMWSSRNETVEYQWFISEYLASNGYVIAYTEGIPSPPFPWRLATAIDKESSLNQNIIDIETALGYLQQQSNVDSSRTGIISWSYAGESAILSQISNPAIGAVIGLSSLGFSSGVYMGSELKNKIDPGKINIPYLLLFEKVAPTGRERTIPDIFATMHSDSRYVYFNSLSHGNFNVIEGMIPGILKTNKVQGWSRGGTVARTGYETICRLSLIFLDATFKGKGTFDEVTLTLKNHLPPEFIDPIRPRD